MTKLVNEILEELYKLDENFKQHKNEIKEMIELFIKSKPKTKITEEFKLELRDTIIQKIHAKNVEKFRIRETLNLGLFFKYFISGAIVTSFIFVSIIRFNSNDSILKDLNGSSFSNDKKEQLAVDLEPKFEKIGDSGFGNLSYLGFNESKENESLRESAVGLGGGGAVSSMVEEASMQMNVDSDIIEPKATSKMPAIDNYVPSINNYMYTGKAFEIPSDKMDVFKLKEYNNKSNEILLSQINIEGFNINKLQNTKLLFFKFVEDKKLGYAIDINLELGSINIYPNYKKWPAYNVGTENITGLSYENYPSEEEVINIADKFIKDYNINKLSYSSGILVDDGMVNNKLSDNNQASYIPDTTRVIYPFVLKGKKVYDYGGYPVGLNISVNVRYNKVETAGPITKMDFTVSDYDIIKDPEEILKIASHGGMYGAEGLPSNYKVNNVLITNPKLEYAKISDYTEGKNIEYFVPAIIFDTISQDKNINSQSYVPRKVIVPLVKDFYKN